MYKPRRSSTPENELETIEWQEFLEQPNNDNVSDFIIF